MRKHIQLISAFTLIMGAQSAWTQQFTPPTFEGLDTDKSEALSKEEVGVFVAGIPAGPNGPANLDDVLGRWDANKDGSVTKEEFDNRPPPPGAGAPPPAT